MSDHPNDVEMEEIEGAAMSVEPSEPTVSNVGKSNLTDAAKAGICSDDETGSTVTIGEVCIDEYFDETFCDDSVVDTTDYREAEATAAANLLPVLINIIGNGDSASGEASGEASEEASVEASGEKSGEASGEASGGSFEEKSGEASSDYQDKLTDIVRSAHTSIENADDEQPTASTSTSGRRPLCVVIPREAAIAASQALVSVTPKRRRPGDNDRPERTFLLRGYIDANQSIRKSCQDYGLNLPEAAYDAINLDEHLIRNCYMSILPARTSVHDILDKYVKERNANVDMFHFLLVAFDEVLPIWCLRRVEQLQHEDISKKFPGRRMCTIYGLIHFLRYTMYLPRLFSRLEFTRVVERDAKIHPVVEFLNGFFVYMVDHGLHIDINLDYDIMVFSDYQKAYEVLHKTYPAEPSIVID